MKFQMTGIVNSKHNISEINRMLARDDQEFEMFEEFDRLRYEEEKQIYTNFEYGVNYRLMPENEVPEYIKIKEEKKTNVLGKRRNYRDFYNVIPDIDETSEEERKSRKRASQRLKRRRRAQAKKNGKLKAAMNGGATNGKVKKGQSNGKHDNKTFKEDKKGDLDIKVKKEEEKDDD